MPKESIRINDLSIGYQLGKHIRVISGHISASLYSGELTCLTGANGTGKSTLLRTLSAFQPKLQGEIWIDEKEISDFSDKELSQKIGVVLTDKINIQNMSVTELVSMGRSPYTGFWGKLNSEDKHIVENAIVSVGIERLRERMIQTLSDGERQKALIAKTLAQETPVIYLDEPTAFLDFPSKVEIMQLLHRLTRQEDKTIFLSTHDLELALQIADKIWIMDRKKGITTGTPEDLSLNGDLGSFFNRKGILFDRHSGLFRIENTYTSAIRLTGKGEKEAMVQKALRRNGIQAGDFVQSDICIDAGMPGKEIHICYKTEKEATVTSIDEMLQFISVIKSCYTKNA